MYVVCPHNITSPAPREFSILPPNSKCLAHVPVTNFSSRPGWVGHFRCPFGHEFLANGVNVFNDDGSHTMPRHPSLSPELRAEREA